MLLRSLETSGRKVGNLIVSEKSHLILPFTENGDGTRVDIDIRRYFSAISHEELRKYLSRKIPAKRFPMLIDILITSIIVGEGKSRAQRSILPPILSNIYVPYVIDEWFEGIKNTHMRARQGK